MLMMLAGSVSLYAALDSLNSVGQKQVGWEPIVHRPRCTLECEHCKA